MPGSVCWCCAGYGLETPGVEGHGGAMCAPCRNRSPTACEKAHEKAGGVSAASWEFFHLGQRGPDYARLHPPQTTLF